MTTPTTGAAPTMTTSRSEAPVLPDHSGPRTLVIGNDGALAERVIRSLHARGQEVAVVGTSGFGLATEYGGSARAIDFGLSGAKYGELVATASRMIVAVEPDRARFRDPASSRHVRAAAEALEFVRTGGGRAGVTFLSSLLAFGSALGTVGEGDFNVGQGFASPFEESLALAEQIMRRARAYTSALGILRAPPLIGDAERGILDQGSLFAEVLTLMRSGALHAETIWSDKPFFFETFERVGSRLERMNARGYDGVVHVILQGTPTDREVFEWYSSKDEGDRSRSGRILGFLKRPAQSALSSPEKRAFGWGLRFAKGHECELTEGAEPAWTGLLNAFIGPETSGGES